MHEAALVHLLQELCRILASEQLTVADVQQQLEHLMEAGDRSINVVVEPVPGSQEPAFVRLDGIADAGLGLEAMQSAFGEYRRLPRIHPKDPVEYAFKVVLEDQPYQCTVIAEMSGEEAAASAASVRRDRRGSTA